MESAPNWQLPVVLADPQAEAFVVVRNAQEAAAYLMDFWPKQHGPAFYKAIRLCADALDGEAADEDVRDAFLAAAHDANIAITMH
ncbi:DUF982 domain-containing protein [Shinella sp. HZN7]|uniref:DUF982 domain-containing protein n=1 Tax=Shinella sp. (strain HZN7) TaxID=879274 RepID=UPI0007DA5097|nr:DUF982 domain-containing protein [Shinella sp. HZN7]ANH07868.1 hypothetical protein shn_27335 [Shinella sp. HZN7]